MNSTSPGDLYPDASPGASARSAALTRSSTDRKLGGVAAGLARHLGIDPTIVRVGFAVSLLFSGVGLVAYLVMLAVVPSDDVTPAAASPIAA